MENSCQPKEVAPFIITSSSQMVATANNSPKGSTMANAQITETQDKKLALANELIASASGANATATTYTYDCQVSIAAAAGGVLTVTFKTNGNEVAQFIGGLGGAIAGGYTGWGKAWFNTPVENLKGKSAGFTLELVGVLGGTAHVQITDGSTFIGNCSTGGIGIGGGAAAGVGKFS